MADDDDKKKPPAKDGGDDDLGDAGKKALDAERSARRDAEKQLKELRDELQGLKDKDKGDAEKLTDRITAAEKRADDAEAKVVRLEVATSKGLNAAQAKRLVGATKEELEADADELLKTFKPAGDGDGDERKGGPQRKPSEDLRGGGDPTSEPGETNPTKLAESVPRL